MESPVIARSEVLERVDGDIEFLAELTEEFFKSFPVQFAELAAASANQDADKTERKAHTLKGALRNLGGARCGDCAHKIELAAKNGDLAQAKEMLSELEKQVLEFQAEFRLFLQEF